MTQQEEPPAMTAPTTPAATPQTGPAWQGHQDLQWDTNALPDGQMLATAAARLLASLSALAAHGNGRPAPVLDPRADKAAALTLIKAAHQLLCAATIGRPAAKLGAAR